ncbi:MAG: LTA synthase family protein, partial [Chitinophagaceae bacterium]
MKNPLPRKSIFRTKFSIVYALLLFVLCLSLLTRISLFLTVSSKGIPLTDVIEAFLIGFGYDLLISGLLVIPIAIHLVFQNDFIYQRTVFKYFFTVGLIIVLLFAFTDIIPRDFSPELHAAFIVLLAIRLIIYGVLYHRPYRSRVTWRKTMLYFFVTLFVFCLLLNAVSEWFFWNEFSSRYNFIAVDYLIYTHEVVGNIRESYPIVWILAGLGALCLGVVIALK